MCAARHRIACLRVPLWPFAGGKDAQLPSHDDFHWYRHGFFQGARLCPTTLWGTFRVSNACPGSWSGGRRRRYTIQIAVVTMVRSVWDHRIPSIARRVATVGKTGRANTRQERYHPRRATGYGLLWPDPLWPRPSLAMTNFGHDLLWP